MSDAKRPDASSFYSLEEKALESLLREPSSGTPDVPEALLHDLWAQQHFDSFDLTTTGGRALTLLTPGIPNTDAGPDFLNAHLRLGDTDWRGAVEIHRTSSGWIAHGHHEDPRYDAVVLHVVLRAGPHTGRLKRADGSALPELVLFPHLRAPLRRLLYRFLTRADDEIPCADGWPRVPDAVRRPWIREMALERLDEKRERLADAYLTRPDLEALFHERLFAGLGYAKNAEPMADLARRLPLRLVRTLDDPIDHEALHLGTAGLLPTPADLPDADRTTADYVITLRRRYTRLQERHALVPMEKTQWQFFRLRPPNFPPLRIAQASAWLGSDGLLRRDPLGALRHALHSDDALQALHNALAVRPSNFWTTHFRLEKPTGPRDPSLGRPRIDTLLVNAVLPVLLLWAEQHDDPEMREAVLDVFEALPATGDRVTRCFEKLGTKPKHALEAQGLHQLYRTRCTEARCLTCAIGRSVLGMEERGKGGKND